MIREAKKRSAGGVRETKVQECELTCGLRIRIENPSEYIQESLVKTGEFEPGVTRLITSILKPGDSFFDVGANIGYLSLVAASRTTFIHAFEPVPRLAMRVRENAALNQLQSVIRVVEAALSDRRGVATLYVADRVDDGSHSLIAGVEARAIQQIEVQTLTLDEYLDEVGCLAPTLIKIDVEGCEALVLNGGSRTLRSLKPPIWIFETADRLAEQLGESAASVIGRFFACGYRVFRISEETFALKEVNEKSISGDLSNYLAIRGQPGQLRKLLRLSAQAL